MTKITSLILASVVSLTAFSTALSQVYYTEPVGFYKYNAIPGSNLFTAGLTTRKEFQGYLSYTTSGTTTVLTQTGGTWTTGTYAASGGMPTHYVEVLTTGSNQGRVLDVKTNTTSTLEVYGNLGALGVSGTSQYALRKHVTLGTLFKNGAGLAVDNDSVTIYLDNGQSLTFTYNGDYWEHPVIGNADNQVIYPGQGVILNVNSAKAVTIGGNDVPCVRQGPLMVPLYGPGKVNLVGLVNPMPGSTVQLGSMGLQTALAVDNDSISLKVPGSLASAGTFLYDGVTMINGNGDDANATAVPLTQAAVINVNSDKMYVQPTQYTNP